jgi:NHLM bacteriocin system ABC transporter peptidase/ATP-binding protein
MPDWFNKKTRIRRRVKTPTILQMEAVECGAASLGMILAYHGRWVPLETLRSDCGVSRDGSKASNVLRAARSYGLLTKGLKKDVPQLKEMMLPFVVFWNFNHYVVVEGFTDKEVLLNDPGEGRRAVINDEFDESFTGVVLTFEPGPEFEKGGHPPSVVRSLKHRMRGTAIPLVFLLIASLVGVAPALANAAYARIFIDNILLGGMTDWLKPLLMIMAATALLILLLDLLSAWVSLKLRMKLAIGQSAKYFWHVLRLPMDFFMQRYSGEIGSRLPINDSVGLFIGDDLTRGAFNLVMVLFYAAIMFKYDILLTFLGVGMALANIGILQYLSRRRIEQGRKTMQAAGKLMGTSLIGLQSIETIKAGGTESEFFAKWAGYQARTVTAEQELNTSSLFLSSIPALLGMLNTAALICIGGLRVMQGALTIGMLVTFQALMASFSLPVNGLMNLGARFHSLENQLQRLDDVLDYPVDIAAASSLAAEEAIASASAIKLTGHLELKDLVFGHSRLEPPLLSGISLRLPPGQRVALVGGSGSGKSTLAKVVAGLNHPWSGQLLFDGKDRSAYPRAVICNSLACVDQEISLFEGTIRDNIAMWDDTLDDARIVTAAKDACIHDFITSLKGDYNYKVEEGGRNFSGGQRQRLEIARALVTEPSLLVLDEATSALDPVTEKTVMDNFRRRGCSCLVVAHRLSTIRDSDEIIVLQRGQIVQRGTHEELVANPGLYSALVSVECTSANSGEELAH